VGLLLACLTLGLFDIQVALTVLMPISLTILLGLTMVAEHLEKEELKGILTNFQTTSTELLEQIENNYNNSRLTNEIGETITSQTNIEDVLIKVVQLFQKRLNYDRGMIMLANADETRLIFRAGFGYKKDKLNILKKSAFHLDRPDATGLFISCFKEQIPYLINDIKEIGPKLSSRSLAFAREMGAQSFICCPIICDGSSLGILAVDNLKSKKPLVESDLSLLQGIAHVIGISVRNVELLDSRNRQLKSVLQTLAASIDTRDPLTAGHSEKVTEYASGICSELNLTNDTCETIRVAAMLHDYGKIGVPDAILKKPGRLTKEEYDIVKTHAMKTRDILMQINFSGSLRQVPEIAGAHHEKIDGSGYPLGLKGDQIPLGAKIIAVADFFEAITAKRHYRDPLPLETAFDLLEKESGVHFEPHIVEAFIRFYQKANPTHQINNLRKLKKVS
jgi:HD-GYP domain-containing protein (c-di-GMP phosphodiesterase class II)